MYIKAFVPTALLLVATVTVTWLVSGLRDNPNFSSLFELARWIPFSGFAATLLLGAFTSYRLWRWGQGYALTCECGGLLGRERLGIRGRGDYRHCLACGRNVNHRHYE
jgi:hypothetical protein